MPTLTLVSMINEPVDLTINGTVTTLEPGGRLVEIMDGPVNLAARVSGPRRGFFRPGQASDGLVQDRAFAIEIDPNDNTTARVRFRVT
jgi:hypothetical protein